jgi:hypothetical protein
MNIRMSRFDNSIICIEATEESSKVILDRLDKRGLGFALFGEDVDQPMIVIDHRAGLSDDQLLAVEAHEVGHVVSGSSDEETAELYGIAMLRLSGHHSAAELLLKRGII